MAKFFFCDSIQMPLFSLGCPSDPVRISLGSNTAFLLPFYRLWPKEGRRGAEEGPKGLYFNDCKSVCYDILKTLKSRNFRYFMKKKLRLGQNMLTFAVGILSYIGVDFLYFILTKH